MKRILLVIFFLPVMFSCNNKQNNTSPTSRKEKTRVQESKCDKCDKDIVEKLEKSKDSISYEDLDRFLCALDENCKWSKKFPYEQNVILASGKDSIAFQRGVSTYEEIAQEIAIMYLYYMFTDYMKILESNKGIDKRYLLSLMEYEEPMDLPFAQILDSLQHYQSDHPIKDSLIGVFEENVQRFGY